MDLADETKYICLAGKACKKARATECSSGSSMSSLSILATTMNPLTDRQSRSDGNELGFHKGEHGGVPRPMAVVKAGAVQSEFAKNKSEIIALSCPAHFTILPSERPTAIGRMGGRTRTDRLAGRGSRPQVALTCSNHATAARYSNLHTSLALSLPLSLTPRYLQYGATHATRE